MAARTLFNHIFIIFTTKGPALNKSAIFFFSRSIENQMGNSHPSSTQNKK
jgi:hypothetical protein